MNFKTRFQRINVIGFCLFAIASGRGAGATDLRLQVILLSNDDGKQPGAVTVVTPTQFSDLVKQVNIPFQGSGIRFVFDPQTDWMTMSNTVLNTDGPNMLALGNAIADKYPGKIVCLLRWGNGIYPTGNGNAFPPPGANPRPSVVPYDVAQNYVALPNNLANLNQSGRASDGTFVAHELGHYLGLYHTFPDWTDRCGVVYSGIAGCGPNMTPPVPSAAQADSAVVNFIAGHGGTASALDGDGLTDTPADPSPVLYQAHGLTTCSLAKPALSIQGTINGVSKSFTFSPDLDNVMSYFLGVTGICAPAPGTRHFSAQQIARMQRTLKYSVRRALLGNWSPSTGIDMLGRYIAPRDAVPGGMGLDGLPYLICRGTRADGSIQPGRTRSGSTEGCITAYGTQQENLTQFEYLVPSWTGNTWDNTYSTLIYNNGHVPPNAVQGGVEATGETLYYCRGLLNGNWQPGKIRAGFGGCYISYGGSALLMSGRYQVLVNLTPSMPMLTVAASGTVPADAIAGGVDSDGETLYLCNAKWGGGIHPGKLKPSFGVCLIAYGSSEIPVATYSIMVGRYTGSTAFSTMTNTFPAGFDSDQEALSVCRGQSGGATLPGKYKPSAGKCYVGIYGGSVAVSPFEVLTVPPLIIR